MFSRIVSFAFHARRICSTLDLPSFGTSTSRADWWLRTFSVFSPNVSTMRRASTLPMPLISPEAR